MLPGTFQTAIVSLVYAQSEILQKEVRCWFFIFLYVPSSIFLQHTVDGVRWCAGPAFGKAATISAVRFRLLAQFCCAAPAFKKKTKKRRKEEGWKGL